MGRALDATYQVQKLMWRVLRPRTHGVKVILTDPQGRIILIRNSYGRSDLFVLPGGGVRPFESPVDAAVREVREELGLEVHDLVFVSSHSTGAEGKRDTVHLFRGAVSGDPRIDPSEISEAGFFSPHALPPTTSPATRRRVAEYLGQRTSDGSW